MQGVHIPVAPSLLPLALFLYVYSRYPEMRQVISLSDLERTYVCIGTGSVAYLSMACVIRSLNMGASSPD